MSKILVTGATGHLGRIVTEELLQKGGGHEVGVMVRDAAKAENLAAKGATVIHGDYNDYASLVAAFKGVNKLYFVSGSDIMNRAAQHENVVKAAKEAGVGHIIYTSFQRKSEGPESPIAFVASAHILAEQRIKESGLTYTILKHALYTDVLPMFLGPQVLETGTIFLPAGTGKTSFATRADMAAAGVAVLTGTDHENKTYEIAGGKSYSMSDVAAMLSKLSGKDIRYAAPTAEEFSTQMSATGLPPEAVQGTTTFCAAIAQGEFDFPDDTLGKLLQRELVSVEAYLKDAYSL